MMTLEERAKMLMRALNDDECDSPDCCYHGGLYEHLVGTLRAVRAEALEEAKAALCPGCRHSVETWEQKDWLPDGPFRQFRGWLHKYGNGQILPCEAATIRALVAGERGEGK